MTKLLLHQIEYYRDRAPEYDEWFYRKGLYDHGAEEKQRWEREAQIVRDQLLNAPKCEQILEIAPGTGIWTQELIKISQRVTAVDASPEMININRAKLRSDKVNYQRADIFKWQPKTQFNMVFFGFWLSHVPADRLSSFLQTVHNALKPGGRLFMVDSQLAEKSRSAEQYVDSRDDLQKRILSDGREYEIVKIYYDPAQLSVTLQQHGFDIQVEATQRYFIYADGKKAL